MRAATRREDFSPRGSDPFGLSPRNSPSKWTVKQQLVGDWQDFGGKPVQHTASQFNSTRHKPPSLSEPYLEDGERADGFIRSPRSPPKWAEPINSGDSQEWLESTWSDSFENNNHLGTVNHPIPVDMDLDERERDLFQQKRLKQDHQEASREQDVLMARNSRAVDNKNDSKKGGKGFLRFFGGSRGRGIKAKPGTYQTMDQRLQDGDIDSQLPVAQPKPPKLRLSSPARPRDPIAASPPRGQSTEALVGAQGLIQETRLDEGLYDSDTAGPSYGHKIRGPSKSSPSQNHPLMVKTDPFDVSAFSADPFGRNPSPRKFVSPIGSDDFSDPFFPAGRGGGRSDGINVPDASANHVFGLMQEEPTKPFQHARARLGSSPSGRASHAQNPVRNASPGRQRSPSPAGRQLMVPNALPARTPSPARQRALVHKGDASPAGSHKGGTSLPAQPRGTSVALFDEDPTRLELPAVRRQPSPVRTPSPSQQRKPVHTLDASPAGSQRGGSSSPARQRGTSATIFGKQPTFLELPGVSRKPSPARTASPARQRSPIHNGDSFPVGSNRGESSSPARQQVNSVTLLDKKPTRLELQGVSRKPSFPIAGGVQTSPAQCVKVHTTVPAVTSAPVKVTAVPIGSSRLLSRRVKARAQPVPLAPEPSKARTVITQAPPNAKLVSRTSEAVNGRVGSSLPLHGSLSVAQLSKGNTAGSVLGATPTSQTRSQITMKSAPTVAAKSSLQQNSVETPALTPAVAAFNPHDTRSVSNGMSKKLKRRQQSKNKQKIVSQQHSITGESSEARGSSLHGGLFAGGEGSKLDTSSQITPRSKNGRDNQKRPEQSRKFLFSSATTGSLVSVDEQKASPKKRLKTRDVKVATGFTRSMVAHQSESKRGLMEGQNVSPRHRLDVLSDEDSCSLASARSNISQLKKYMRSSRKSRDPSLRALGSDTVVSNQSSYDSVADPMQRAGLRLLSAAVVPIQSAARRHLAMHKALSRMWAIVIVQSLARRWLVQHVVYEKIVAAIMIQACYRGFRVRDQFLLEHCCAIEIQRIVRGHLATLLVYEDIFRITIVQSTIRRKQAIDRATDRMIFIIQLQALARGYLVRRDLEKLTAAAICVQTAWRTFFHHFNYQLDLLDVTIVQSIWRRNVAVRNYREMKWLRYNDAAATIQAQWRCYVCSKWYLEFVAATMIQAQIRCFLMSRGYTMYKLQILRYEALTKIQAQWRCFSCSRRYLQTIAAIMIQSQWRSYACSRDYLRVVAAVMIQSQWRSYSCSKSYLMLLAATIIQAQWRSYVCRLAYRQYRAATIIQALWRSYVCRIAYRQYIASVVIQSCWRSFFMTRRFFIRIGDVLIVQSVARKWLAQKSLRDYREMLENEAALTIQRVWRGFLVYANFMFVIADIVVVQSVSRRWLAARQKRMLIRDRRSRAAIIIQSWWRGNVRQTEFLILKYEKAAATTIQRHWRRFWAFSHFVIAVDRSILLQAVFRGFRQRVMYALQKYAAIEIQQAFRYVRNKQIHHVNFLLASILSAARPFATKECETATTIQSAVRRRQARIRFVTMREEMIPETIKAAVLVQRNWRGVSVRMKGLKFTNWHRMLYVENPAAICIQRNWRGFNALQSYWHALGSAIQIQGAVRRWMARLTFASMRKVYLKGVCATKMQALARRYLVRKRLSGVSKLPKLQAFVRRYLARLEVAEMLGAAILIQCAFRGHQAKKEAKQRRLIYLFVRSATSSESNGAKEVQPQQESLRDWEMAILRQRQVEHAARRIQRFFLMVRREVDMEIQSAKAKRRRKSRRKQKQSQHDADDDLLENIWSKTMDCQDFSSAAGLFYQTASTESAGPGRVMKPMSEHNGNEWLRQATHASLASRPPISRHGDPPESPLVRQQKMMSRRPASASNRRPRVPSSRLRTLSHDEMEQDFHLEEAWIDTEIRRAKDRRINERRSRRAKKASTASSSSATSAAPRSGSTRRTMEV